MIWLLKTTSQFTENVHPKEFQFGRSSNRQTMCFSPSKWGLESPSFGEVSLSRALARDATLQAIAERPQRRGDSVDRPEQLDRCPIHKLNLSTCLGYVWGITHTIEQTEKGLFVSNSSCKFGPSFVFGQTYIRVTQSWVLASNPECHKFYHHLATMQQCWDAKARIDLTRWITSASDWIR